MWRTPLTCAVIVDTIVKLPMNDSLSICMLSKNDIAMLHGMFGKLMKENNEIFGRELKREIRDEMHSLIAASESRVITRLEAKIEHVKEEIIDGVIDMLDRTVYPRLDRHDQEIAQLQVHHGLA